MSLKKQPKLKNKQQGSMLIMALFIIIVLALIGAAMVQINADGSRSIVYEVYGSRALHAANSSNERTLSKLFGPAPVLNYCQADITEPVALPNINAFSGCSASVSCQSFAVNQIDYAYRHYRITSTATCAAGDIITQRRVAIEARDSI